jgi:putative transcriptional regulator
VPAEEDLARLHCRLEELLAERGMTLTALADAVGVSLVNLSVLKNDRARAIRFSTLIAICDALGCQPGDLFTVRAHGTPKGRRYARPDDEGAR